MTEDIRCFRYLADYSARWSDGDTLDATQIVFIHTDEDPEESACEQITRSLSKSREPEEVIINHLENDGEITGGFTSIFPD